RPSSAPVRHAQGPGARRVRPAPAARPLLLHVAVGVDPEGVLGGSRLHEHLPPPHGDDVVPARVPPPTVEPTAALTMSTRSDPSTTTSSSTTTRRCQPVEVRPARSAPTR